MGTMLIIGMGGKSKKGTNHMNPMEQYLSGQSSDGHASGGYGLTEDDATGKKTGQLTFSKPAGFKVPDGVKNGESFDAMASLKLVNGKLVLDQIDGAPVHDEDGSDEKSDSANENNDDESDESDGSSEDLTDESHDSGEEPESEDSSEAAPDDDSSPAGHQKPDDEGEEGPDGEDFLSAIERRAKKLKK